MLNSHQRRRLISLDIWDYSQKRWGRAKANAYIRDLWQVMQRYADNPNLSANQDHIRPGYRKARSGSHVIFYKKAHNGIDVIRILHQAMDFERHL